MSQEAVDPRVAAGLPAQLTRRAELLAGGAEPVGWKVGFNLPSVQQAFGITQPISELPNDCDARFGRRVPFTLGRAPADG